jgi:hypothetical protein
MARFYPGPPPQQGQSPRNGVASAAAIAKLAALTHPTMKSTRLLLVLLALATGAVAQENPAKLALARQVITAMRADKMFDAMTAQMKQMAGQSMPIPAEANPEKRQKMEEFKAKVLDMSMESAKGLIAQLDHIYADVYSEAELQAMKGFFSSPEGQSMLAKQPQIMAHVMPLMQQMQRDLLPKIKEMAEQMKAELKTAEAAKAAAAAPAKAPETPAAEAKKP